MLQLTGLGAEESDSDSDLDVPDISHMPAVENTLDDLQYAELLLRYPQPTPPLRPPPCPSSASLFRLTQVKNYNIIFLLPCCDSTTT